MQFDVQFCDKSPPFALEMSSDNDSINACFGAAIKGDKGDKGFSPVVTVNRNNDNTGVRISIQDEDSTETADVFDGVATEALSIEEINEILGW